MIVGLVDIQNMSHNSNHIQYFVSQLLMYKIYGHLFVV
jgi:hypothetical protein